MERLVSSLLLSNQQEHQRSRISILGALSVVIVLLLTLLVYTYSRNAAKDELQKDFDTYSSTTADRISVALNNQITAIERMASRWEVAQGTSYRAWKHDAESYIRDLPGLESLEWIDRNHHIRWSVKHGGDTEPRGLAYLSQASLPALFANADSHHKLLTESTYLNRGGQGVVIIRKVEAGIQSGYLAATVSFRGLLRPLTQQLAMDGYVMSLTRSGKLAYQGIPSSTGNIKESVVPLAIEDGSWQLKLQMTVDRQTQRRMLLPNMVMSAGIGTACLVVIIFYFWSLGIRKTFELQQSKQFLQSVINNVPQYIFWKDRFSIYQGSNLNFARAAGYISGQDIIGKTDFDFPWSESEALKYRTDDQRIMELGQPELRIQETQRTAAGEDLFVETNKIPLRDESGNVIGILGTYEDVTQRKLAEAEIRQSRDQLEATLKATPDLLFEIDESGRYMAVHETSSKLMTMLPEEILGKTIDEILPEDAASAMAEALHEAAASGSSSGKLLHLNLPDGEAWFELFVASKAALPGEAKRFIVISRNITQRKRSEDALLIAKEEADAANRAKSEFLSTMSHEIRTPMNGVIGMTSLLFDTPLTQEQKEYAETIRLSAENLLRIIDDVLDFSKIEAGHMAIEHIDFSLRQIVESSVDLVLTKAHEKSLVVSSFVDPEVPDNLVGDPVRLRQILLNFMNNAIKFTDQGKVLVKVGLDSADFERNRVRIRIEVQDTGIGISQASQKKLFQPFSQADNSTTRQYGGTGLGLSICKRLTELMHGEIGMQSAEGKGSTFWVCLPFEQSKNLPDKVSEGHLPGLNILVMGECGEHRAALQAYLEHWEMVPAFADNWQQAGTSLIASDGASCRFDLLILMQPVIGIGILDAVQMLVMMPETRNLPILACLNMPNSGLRSALIESGAAGVLVNPLKESELFNAIAAAMSPLSQKPHLAGIAAPAEFSNAQTPTRHDRRVLLVEDNQVNQRVAVKLLNKLGINMDVASNGLEAVEKVQQADYDLILMDCQMPVMDGFGATLQIRRNEFTKPTRTPIIAMTANAMQGDREQCLAAGMDDYLAKPIDFAKLQAMLDRWLPDAGNHNRTGPGSKTLAMADQNQNDAAIDLSRLREFLDNDDTAINELLAVFGESLRDINARLAQAMSDKENSPKALAHELKGSAANIGAIRLSGLAKDLETQAEAGNWVRLAEIHHAIEKEIYSINRFIVGRHE